MERIQAEGHSSKARRDRILVFAAGYAKGFAEGKESGFALGLAEGIDKGRESAARANATEIASFKATNEAVLKQLGNILEQSNGIATGQLIATQTTSDLVVENRKLSNKVEALEDTVAAQTVELVTLKQLNEEQKRLNADQANELIVQFVLRTASSNYLGTASTARVSASVWLYRAPPLQFI